MDKIDEVLVGLYIEKCSKHTNSTLYPLYSGMIIFSGAVLVAMLNQSTTSYLPFLIFVLIILAVIILILTLHNKAKYEEYHRKYATLIIKELASISISNSYEELVKEITDRTLFEKDDVETILFRLLNNN